MNTEIGGFYIDIGAFDPICISVTKAFSMRGWKGINVKPLLDKLIFAKVSDQMYVTGRIWWSSSQDDQTSKNAYGLWTGNNLYALTQVGYNKVENTLAVRPIRAF